MQPLRGQVHIEITFSVVVIVLLILGMVRIFYWVTNDSAARMRAQEDTLNSPVGFDVNDNYRQLRPSFFEGTPMNGITVSSEIFGANRLK